MSDLIERLRYKYADLLHLEAADRIEELKEQFVESCMFQHEVEIQLRKRSSELKSKNERLQAALEAVRGFCKYCGATYPHRYGEGRCGHCAALDGEQEQDNE